MNTTYWSGQATVPFLPSRSGESCRVRWMTPRRLMVLLTVPSIGDIQPRRLPSLIFTPGGPLAYQWPIDFEGLKEQGKKLLGRGKGPL